MGSNPSTVYWMDIDPNVFVVNIEMFEKKKKEVGDGPFKNKIM